ncbi:MAG: ribosome assembly cofactor RimP [Bacteroidales bacterium]|nr:ribosome assembly cofactor RimP [Bacteroidales bacterium]
MIERDRIIELVEKIIREAEIFLVDITVTAKNKILIWIDKKDGITIDECAEISKELENHLDRSIENFELEVSSPGLDTSFKVRQQYDKNIGREIEIVTEDNKIHKGELLQVTEDGIKLEIIKNKKTKGKKEDQATELSLGFNQIKSAKVIVTF